MPKIRWVALGCVLFLILGIAATSYFTELRKISSLGRILDARMDQLVLKSRKIQDYRSKIEFFSTPEGVEKIAREDFNMAYPDEKVYKIVVISKDVLSESKE